jgi:hypothetical protein
MASNSNKDLTFKVLFDTRWFFGEISEESAKVILMEASESDGRTVKRMIFLKADGQPNKLRLFLGLIRFDLEDKPHFRFDENHINFWCHGIGNPTFPGGYLETMVMRKETFKLQELSMVKVVDSGVNPETLKRGPFKIPLTLQQEVKKYQDCKTRFDYLYGSLLETPL